VTEGVGVGLPEAVGVGVAVGVTVGEIVGVGVCADAVVTRRFSRAKVQTASKTKATLRMNNTFTHRCGP
jgi:hypothetical protein